MPTHDDHRSVPPLRCLLSIVIAALVTLTLRAPDLRAQKLESGDGAKAESLKVMQARAARLIVKIPMGAEARSPQRRGWSRAELVEAPLIHYSDQVRNLPESTLWVWEQEGLPVLFCKIEKMTAAGTGAISWQYCCTPATSEKADVEWERQFRWRASETTFTWVPLADEADPREQAPARLIQMKAIVRGFGGETEQTPINSRQKMRLLTSPLRRFDAPDRNVLDGAVFGLTSNGTNPDVLLIVEALREAESDARWRYAIVGMTGDAVNIVQNDKAVWSKAYTKAPGDHRSWMWYVTDQ